MRRTRPVAEHRRIMKDLYACALCASGNGAASEPEQRSGRVAQEPPTAEPGYFAHLSAIQRPARRKGSTYASMS
jgi:hypothetical protein